MSVRTRSSVSCSTSSSSASPSPTWPDTTKPLSIRRRATPSRKSTESSATTIRSGPRLPPSAGLKTSLGVVRVPTVVRVLAHAIPGPSRARVLVTDERLDPVDPDDAAPVVDVGLVLELDEPDHVERLALAVLLRNDARGLADRQVPPHLPGTALRVLEGARVAGALALDPAVIRDPLSVPANLRRAGVDQVVHVGELFRALVAVDVRVPMRHDLLARWHGVRTRATCSTAYDSRTCLGGGPREAMDRAARGAIPPKMPRRPITWSECPRREPNLRRATERSDRTPSRRRMGPNWVRDWRGNEGKRGVA
jgi:hypothetical protein